MEILEMSKITLNVDDKIVDKSFHDSNDAWQKAINHIMAGAKTAVIQETVVIQRKD